MPKNLLQFRLFLRQQTNLRLLRLLRLVLLQETWHRSQNKPTFSFFLRCCFTQCSHRPVCQWCVCFLELAGAGLGPSRQRAAGQALHGCSRCQWSARLVTGHLCSGCMTAKAATAALPAARRLPRHSPHSHAVATRPGPVVGDGHLARIFESNASVVQRCIGAADGEDGLVLRSGSKHFNTLAELCLIANVEIKNKSNK